MKPELYWIREIAPHRLAIMPRPRGGEWLRDEVAGWKLLGVDTVVSLLESHEVRALDLEAEAAICSELGIELISYPIADRGTPAGHAHAAALVDGLCERLRSGRAVAVHCRAGIGRTGIIGACILLRLGIAPADVFPMLSRARTLPMPDTEAQAQWVAAFGRR